MSSHEPQGALGNSEAMRQVELLLRRVADIDGSLLITGESGVGKEVAARFVHQVSTRTPREPFIAVNCAAIPSELIESQLFGQERGAFTSAQARHHGHVERAGNGALFLDEVGKLPMPMQAKLLRLIEERTFTRVGGEATIKTGARIICATNTDLEAAVKERRFREDLYLRINVIRVAIPRLRDRSDDILPLAQLFMREFSEAFDRDVHGFTPEAEQALLEHPWPGNVRELRNRVEQAVALSLAPQIIVEALFPTEAARPSGGSFVTLAEVRDRAEREHIRAVMGHGDAKPGGGMLSRNLEKSLHRALACANERRHGYATLEHLLLSLTEDQDAVAVLRACGVELERLRREVLNYADNELANLIVAYSDDAKPTASFQRVLQRAAIHVQSSGREEVTGANVLVAMFAERESHAVYFLQEQGMTRFDAVNYISHGNAKAPGRSETRRAQGAPGDDRGADMRSLFGNVGRATPLIIDETKIIAAILCARMILPDDAAGDPIGSTVDLYERILAELRARGRGSPGKS
jgi:transcriptional regulator with AAA-type ATPase domain